MYDSAFNSSYRAGGRSWRGCLKYDVGFGDVGRDGVKKDGLVIWGFILCRVGKSLLGM